MRTSSTKETCFASRARLRKVSELAARGLLPWSKRFPMKLAAFVFRRPWLYSLLGRLARFTLRWTPRFLIYTPLNAWGKQRDLPPMPKKSFRQEYVAHSLRERQRGAAAETPGRDSSDSD